MESESAMGYTISPENIISDSWEAPTYSVISNSLPITAEGAAFPGADPARSAPCAVTTPHYSLSHKPT